ncbi:MAG: hypothetical protein JW782_04385 [Candidatus Saganbacteria bacterium]|nr:hypothetical protein [Candidatus Saganbacteria bacterium]
MADLKEVELLSTGVFLPGEPVAFDQIEAVLGPLSHAPERLKRMIKKLKSLSKNRIGIEQCHFAIDPGTRQQTETNTSMAVKAIRQALAKANMGPADIDCILLGNLMPDHQTPPTTTLIQEELGIERCAEMEIHSNCTGITKVMQIAHDGIRLGRYKNALAVYTQFSSAYLRSEIYNPEKIGPEHLLLRWFISDSAAAVVLRGHDKMKSGLKVTAVYNESLGGKLEAGMTFCHGGSGYDLKAAYEAGHQHFGQNYKAVEQFAPAILGQGFNRMLDVCAVKPEDIDHVIVTIPSLKLLEKGKSEALKIYAVPHEKWFSNVKEKGYTGAASVIVSLDELLEKKMFKKDQLLAGITIESSKWMVGGFLLSNLG